MESESNKSQLLFSFIQENLDQCKDAKQKNELREKFNKENNLKITQSHFGKTLRDVIKKSGKNFSDFGLKPEKNSSASSSSSSSSSALDTSFESGEVEDSKNLDPEVIKDDIQKNSLKKDDVENGKVEIKYTVKMVAGFWVGFYRLFQMVIPELEDFDEDEKTDLGESTLPLFQKYLQYGFMEFVTPLMTVGGIFASKIKKARALRDEQHKKELEQKELSKNATEEHTDTDKEKEEKKN